MERKINEKFKYRELFYKAIEQENGICKNCVFKTDEGCMMSEREFKIFGHCSGAYRDDKKPIIWIYAEDETE